MNPRFPLERVCTHRSERFQLAFARRALELLPPGDDRELDARGEGLIIRGQTEQAVEQPTTMLQRVYGPHLRIGPLTIRYRTGPVLEEPHMHVSVELPAKHFDIVRGDLLARGANLLHEERSGSPARLRATAPLAQLLGYAKAAAKMTAGSARVDLWLSHYAPVPPSDPGGNAA